MNKPKDVVWGAHVDTTRAFSVVDGRYGYDPAIQGVAMGNRDPARRGRGSK